MKIITVPHPTLRQVAQEIIDIDKKALGFFENLKDTLLKKDNPRGVGLAAPQVDQSWRAFVTYIPAEDTSSEEPVMRLFVNPEIIATSSQLTFGPDPEEPFLEGCLSIPELYGPVPRYTWVELEFAEVKNGQLQKRTERFDQYAARIVQHEFDHLNGRLFIDYSIELDLPLYKEQGKKLVEMSPEMAKAFHHQTL